MRRGGVSPASSKPGRRLRTSHGKNPCTPQSSIESPSRWLLHEWSLANGDYRIQESRREEILRRDGIERKDGIKTTAVLRPKIVSDSSAQNTYAGPP